MHDNMFLKCSILRVNVGLKFQAEMKENLVLNWILKFS